MKHLIRTLVVFLCVSLRVPARKLGFPCRRHGRVGEYDARLWPLLLALKPLVLSVP